MAVEAAMGIFELAKGFPVDDMGKLVTMLSRPDQWAIRAVREEGADYDT